jgi:hypothetical protein
VSQAKWAGHAAKEVGTMSKKPAIPPGYSVERREPVTPFGNPWVVLRNGERVGSAPTEEGAIALAKDDAKMRKPQTPTDS